jgi:hypothetical protein
VLSDAPDILRQVTSSVRSKRRNDSLFAHCVARAIMADAGGEAAARELWGVDAAGVKELGKWQQMKLFIRATPKASRVASFIVLWAWAMRDEAKDSFSITEYQRYWSEGERQAYRAQAEFRELWPEFETPNELAAQIVRNLGDKLDATKLPMQLALVA